MGEEINCQESEGSYRLAATHATAERLRYSRLDAFQACFTGFWCEAGGSHNEEHVYGT